MTPILAATDLSIRSDRAVQRALRLGAQLDLPCRIISVVDPDQPADLLATRTAEIGACLDRLVRTAAAPGQAVATQVIVGDVDQAILEAAAAQDAGLLVLGLHRPRPLLDWLRETTMVRIVRGARRPVLLVADPADHDYARALVPVSFSPSCAAALRAVRTFAPGAALRSFHAVPVPFAGLTGEGPGSQTARDLCAEATQARDQWLATMESDLRPQIEIISGGRTETMARMTAGKPDLIAVGAHTRSSFAPNVLGGFVTDLIKAPPCDVLVVRGP